MRQTLPNICIAHFKVSPVRLQIRTSGTEILLRSHHSTDFGLRHVGCRDIEVKRFNQSLAEVLMRRSRQQRIRIARRSVLYPALYMA